MTAKDWTSLWFSRVRGEDGTLKHSSDFNLNLRTNAGNDWQSRVMCGDSATMVQGTSTAVTATTLTTAGLTASALVDHIIGVAGTVYGVVTANTTTLVTVDRWYNPATPAGAAGTTPANASTYQTFPGSAPAVYLALSSTVQSGSAGDTTLAGELTTNGFARAYFTTYTHSAGTSAVSLAKTFTAAGTATINSEGLFTALTGGTLCFESAETSPPTLVSGDTLAQTVLINY